MNLKKKILVVTGTRAEYGLLKPVIEKILASKKLDLRLLVTGMHTLKKYGLTINDIKKDGMPIRCVVPVAERDDMLSALAKEITGIKKYCEKERPDFILVIGDRDEPFAAVIVAGHLGIPVGHIHGGDVTGNVVDEYIRHSITKFSHLHFAATEKSKQRIINLGEERWRVFNTGTPGLDAPNKVKYLNKKALVAKLGINPNKRWMLVVQHPVIFEKISVFKQINFTLNALKKFQGEKIIIYPNSDSGSDVFIRAIEANRGLPNFYIFRNISRELYLNILKHADLMVGNSSSAIIEAPFFCLPAINIGSRQNHREQAGNIISVPYDAQAINKAVNWALSKKFRVVCKTISNPYGRSRAADRICSIIEKYINDKKLFYKKFIYV